MYRLASGSRSKYCNPRLHLSLATTHHGAWTLTTHVSSVDVHPASTSPVSTSRPPNVRRQMLHHRSGSVPVSRITDPPMDRGCSSPRLHRGLYASDWLHSHRHGPRGWLVMSRKTQDATPALGHSVARRSCMSRRRPRPLVAAVIPHASLRSLACRFEHCRVLSFEVAECDGSGPHGTIADHRRAHGSGRTRRWGLPRCAAWRAARAQRSSPAGACA